MLLKKQMPVPDFFPSAWYPCATCKDNHREGDLFWAGILPKGIEDPTPKQHQHGWHCNECITLNGHITYNHSLRDQLRRKAGIQ